jgi:predicted CXXCH cytochrome family protein
MNLSCSLKTVNVLFVSLLILLATQTIAEASIDCFSCHERSAFQKRVKHEPSASGECFSCHNPHVARFAGLLQHEVKDLCFSCHAEIAGGMDENVVHNPVLKGACTGCHDPHSSDHKGLLIDNPSATCFTCHTELPKKFKNTHAPYAKGQCATCHKPHQSAYPYLLVKETNALCLDCHSQGSVQQKHPNFPEKVENCGSCHNPHGSDRTALIRNVLHEPYAEGCGDCHTGKGVPVRIDTCLECHPEVSEQMASSHNHLVRFEENGCMACHTPHAGDDGRLLKGKERHICGTCHQATFKRTGVAKYSHKKTDACNNCHAPHGSNHPAMFKAEINTVCSECHAKHSEFTHPIGETVFDPRTGQKMTCASCHAIKGTDHDYFTQFDRKKALCIQCHAEY